MRRTILALALVIAAAGAARADGARVRSHATVEVLDDKAQIDDVISRLRKQGDAAPPKSQAHTQAATLKAERPPASTVGAEPHRPVGPEAKEPRPGARRSVLQRGGNPDHTERVRPHKK